MKFKTLFAAAGLAALSATAIAAPNVGVSVTIGDPGFYGRIDIGRVPAPPVLVYEQPVVIVQRPVRHQPIYLRVPPGHEKHWSKHYRKYDACGRPVYFVRDDWYREHYGRRAERREDRREAYREERRYDRQDERRDDRHHGHGNGHGHGRGHGRD